MFLITHDACNDGYVAIDMYVCRFCSVYIA